MRLETKVTDSGLVTLTNGKFATTATTTYTTPTDAQSLIDASIADLPTTAESEAIAEGAVAAVIPEGTSAGDILEWDGAAWDAVAHPASGGGDPVMEWLGA